MLLTHDYSDEQRSLCLSRQQSIPTTLTWSLEVFSKTCGGEMSQVDLVVPLRNLQSDRDYSGNEWVIAYPRRQDGHR